ncbi:MAG: LacI family DNA-binding transcriptional regulator [Euzebyaceae bacterium]|nr:LacI family DNA-binding transcriptional regulator [Euzebyaceae bacterium]
MTSQPMPRQPTMQDVAAQAGVALSSVSRALSGHPDVSPAMRKRVEDAAAALGYEPDLLAQSLRRGSTRTVGFVVRDISNPLFADIAKAAEQTLRHAGYSMLLTNSDGSTDIEAENVNLLRRRRVDGLILSSVSETEQRTLEVLRSTRIPIVLLDRETQSVAASAVISDHYHGIRAAVSELLTLGHRDIAMVSGPREIRPTRERLRGLVDAHRAAGVPLRDDLLRLGSFAEDFAGRHTKDLLALARPPTAILAGGIQSAVGVLTTLAERGIRPGEDIGFVGVDDLPLLRLFNPPISVVTRDSSRIGQFAAQLFLDMVAGAPPRVEVVSTEYVARASSGGPVGAAAART